MNESLTISRASEADLSEVMRLVRGLAIYERLEHQFVATEADFRRALFSERPFAEIWIGRLEGRAIGYVTFFHTYSTFVGKPGLYLEDLFVEEAFRGRGFGSQLFRFVAGLACERNCGRMEWSALDWNAPAISFYENMGAKMQSDWRLFRLDGDSLATFSATSRA
jgi:GNAT superfamily N-acetyltransferase